MPLGEFFERAPRWCVEFAGNHDPVAEPGKRLLRADKSQWFKNTKERMHGVFTRCCIGNAEILAALRTTRSQQENSLSVVQLPSRTPSDFYARW